MQPRLGVLPVDLWATLETSDHSGVCVGNGRTQTAAFFPVCTLAEGRTLPAWVPGVGHRPEAPSLTPGVVMGPPLPPAQTTGMAARCLCSHHMVWGLLSCLPPLRTPEQGTSCRICTPLTEGQTTSKCQGKGDWHPY